ncbi:related to selenocysteine lyase [Cephalotrichum gorgonifer]|uniref:Related to selenocysteine lyase n=1 Tax=Cephalotrichum gorgonifer TaxID=2041049 RepID=A0AAE8MSU6_9PEZI|nr:related to selenocysteine lyase [Cephalotrichum gorgonifer]
MPDITTIRAAFPSLSTPQVFFDNAGGSQTLGTVISSVTSHYTTSNVQLGASYPASQRATAGYTAAFDSAARYLNCPSSRIVFGPSSTQLLRNLSHALLPFEPGDEVVVSLADHESNISPWIDLVARQSLVVRWHRPSSPASDAGDITSLFTARTRLVAVTHASNILGTVNPIRRIADAAHAVGALLAVDGVAYAPYGPIDVRELGADFYVFSWYKVFGPHIATLYVSDAVFPRVRSLGHYFHPTDTLDGKLGLAAASYELLQAVPPVVDYLGAPDGEMRRWMAVQHLEVTAPLLVYLAANEKRYTVHGKPEAGPDRTPVVSFSVKGWSSKAVVEAIGEVSDFGLKWGHFYCPRLVGDILGLLGEGHDGVVRVSLTHYNTVEEVESFIKVLDSVVSSRDSV